MSLPETSGVHRANLSLFEHGILPISFSQKIGKFIVGVSKEIVPPRLLNQALIYQEDYLEANKLHELSAGIVFTNQLYTGPVFRDYLQTPTGKKTVTEVSEVMREAFNQIHPTAASSKSVGELFGFSARIIREDQVDISVLGDCACFSPEIGGGYEQYWAQGFARYTEHNIDWPAQIVALYAGIGHIAYKASE